MQYTNIISPSILKQQKTEQDLFDVLYNHSLIDGNIMYMGRLAQRAAVLFPSKIALIARERTITYQELYARAIQVSALLQAKGVKPRDRVLLLWENSIEFYIAYFGIVQIGAVVAPLNVFLQAREIMHILNDAQPVAMIVSDELRAKLVDITDEQLPPLIRQKDIDLTNPVTTQVQDFAIVDLLPDEMVALLYTSGTTGFPKGVMISSRNIITNIAQGIARIGLGIDENERIFCILPLFHSFAQFTCLWAPFLTCSTVIVVARIDRRYLLDGLKHKPTIFLGVPALFGLLSLLKTAPLDSVKYFVSGGDALPDKIRAAFALIYRRKIGSGYGLTETTPLVASDLMDEAARTNTVGTLVCGIQAQLRGDNGTPVAQGLVGELWVKGDNIMLGYYNAPEATAQVLQDGWFCTGDLAYFDTENRLVITGRSKDLIVNKGFKIYPQEIENLIMGHSLVIRVGVIGREDKTAGQVPIAYVQVRELSPTLEQELADLCIKNLASYKNPRGFILTTKNLPTTATGKVDKKRLHEVD